MSKRLITALALTAVVVSSCRSERADILLGVDATQNFPTVTPSTADFPTATADPDDLPAAEPSPSDEPTAPAEPPTASPDASPTPAPSGTAAPPATATPVGAVPTATVAASPSATARPGDDPCNMPAPTDATLVTTQSVDADGDGRQDVMTVYRASASRTDWRLRVETDAGGRHEVGLQVDRGGGEVRAIGGFDLTGDGGAEELFSTVGSSSTAEVIALNALVGCELVPVTAEGGPIQFAVGGGVSVLSGMECRDTDDDGANDTVVAWQALADPAVPNAYDVTGLEYELRGTDLTTVGTPSLRAFSNEPGFIYGQLVCGDLRL